MNARHAAAVCCIFALLFATAAVAAEDDESVAPPDGVSVTVLPAPADEAPQTDTAKTTTRSKSRPADPIVELSYNGVPFGEVLDDLAEHLGVTIVCTDAKILERRYYRHVRVARSRALAAACGTMLVVPWAGYIVCSEDEVVEGQGAPEIKADPKLNVSLEKAKLSEALKYMWKTTGVPMAATAGLAQSEVTYSAEGKSLAETMEGIATTLEAKAVKGYIVQPVDPEEPLRRLEEMSDEELDEMFREGLSGVRKGQQDGSVPGTDEIRQLMLSGMHDAVRNFSDLPAQERREHVQTGVELIHRFAAITQRLQPDTQQQLRSQVQPFLSVIVAGYVAMPAQQRAELAPLMEALKTFGW